MFQPVSVSSETLERKQASIAHFQHFYCWRSAKQWKFEWTDYFCRALCQHTHTHTRSFH